MSVKSSAVIEVNLDGVTDLPAGKLANVVTFMERLGRAPGAASLPASLMLQTQRAVKLQDYRDLYRRIGQDFLWVSRALMGDASLAEWLNRPTTLVQFLMKNGAPIGLVELDNAAPGECEIVSFGLVPEEVGLGSGHWLMQQVLAGAAASGATRVWLHTCTFDHPAAIPFYLRHGFRAYKSAIEVFDDPRLTGDFAPDAAPHVPVIPPPSPDDP